MVLLLLTNIQHLTSNIPLFAAAFEPLGYGAAAKGMGGAYTAAADDGSAAYWNPAGLAMTQYHQLSASLEDLYGLGLLRYSTLGYTHPNLGGGAAGLHLLRLQTVGEASFFTYAENTYLLAYGRPLWGLLNGGVGLRYYSVASSQKATGVGYDLGLLYRSVHDRLRLAAVAQDINEPRIHWDTGAVDVLPPTLRAGALLRMGPISEFTLEEVWRRHEGQTHRAGMAHHLLSRVLSVRAGLHKSQDQGSWQASFGGSLHVARLDIDYAWDSQDKFGNTHTIGFSFRFGS